MAFLERWRKTDKPSPAPTKKTATPPEPKAEKAVAAPLPVDTGAAKLTERLLRAPHVSEKAASLATSGTYVFDVPLDAEKNAIKQAVERLYKVHVTGVRIVRGKGKPVYRGRRAGRRNAWKKALVTVAKGQSLSLYEGV